MLQPIKKPLLTIAVFIAIMTAVRLGWNDYLNTLDYPDPPAAKDGVLDLRGFAFNPRQTLTLNGEWEFYPDTLLDAAALANHPDAPPAEPVLLPVPGSWNAAWDGAGNGPPQPSAFRYGTYRLRILLDPDAAAEFGIRLSRAGNASAVYVNGQRAGSSGEPAAEAERHEAENVPYTVAVPGDVRAADLIIHVSRHAGEGGITKPIRFGTMDAIRFREVLLAGLPLLLCVFLTFNCLYGLILYYLGARNKGIFYFMALMALLALSTLAVDEKLLFQWVEMSYDLQVGIIYSSYIGMVLFLPLLVNHLFPSQIHPWFVRGFAAYGAACALFFLLSPAPVIFAMSSVLLISAYAWSVAISAVILVKTVIAGKEDTLFLILACLCVGNNMLWAVVMTNSPAMEAILYPFDLIFAILAFTAFWFQRFFRATNESIRLAEKLQIEDKRKDEFLINTSHELRNPLQGISNVLQVILDDPAEPVSARQRERVEIARNVSRRMNIMLDDLIDITRLKEKTIPLDIRPVYLQSIASGVLDMIRVTLDGKPVRLHAEIDGDFPAVLADENRVVQILYNLLHNAAKYTDEGHIAVRAARRGRHAEIEVADTGIGIPEEALQRIFLPYEQSETRDGRGGGFGLGLHICKQLVELHRGTIRAESRPGAGSVFRFTLPLADPDAGAPASLGAIPEAAAAVPDLPPYRRETAPPLAAGFPAESDPFPHAEAPEDAANSKILLVDDDAVNVRVLAQSLAQDGYAVTIATSAEQAVAELDKSRFDLVIADVMMPQMSGYQLTELIRERFGVSELPVLLLTARSRTEDIITGFMGCSRCCMNSAIICGSASISPTRRRWCRWNTNFPSSARISILNRNGSATASGWYGTSTSTAISGFRPCRSSRSWKTLSSTAS